MKKLSLLCLAALAPAWSLANITPSSAGASITGSGPYTWTYQLQLSQDQDARQGLPPTANPVPHVNISIGSFFTLYDFGGYVAGSCAGPTGWECSAQNVGYTPDDVLPFDDVGITNLTWAYIAGAHLNGGNGGWNLGDFSAQSVYNASTQVSYAARGVKNGGAQAGNIDDNVGSTLGPGGLLAAVPSLLAVDNVVPEPGSLALAGLGLMGLALVRRQRARRVAR